MRHKVIAANWKMYKTIEEALAFVSALSLQVADPSDTLIYIAVPFTAIRSVADAAQGTPLVIGAQNMNDATQGAFTGEIAGRMLKEAGAHFVILGHSERRRLFNETDLLINRKVKKALKEGLQPLLCVGETLEERDADKAQHVVRKQILESLKGIKGEEVETIILSYEPVWAIGTDRSATPEEGQQMCRFCREQIATEWGAAVADKILILYGGSVTGDNAKELLAESDIDGVLVGGASLSPESFNNIIKQR